MRTNFFSCVLGATVCLCGAALAQTQPETTTSPAFQQDTADSFNGVLFKSGGSLYYYENGKGRRLDKDLRISDRVTVRANGSVLKDGNPFTIPDGHMLFPDGRLESTPVGFAPTVAR